MMGLKKMERAKATVSRSTSVFAAASSRSSGMEE